MTTESLLKLRSKLPRKWAATIANSIDISQDQVRKVMRGDSNNPIIIATAIRLANQKKKQDLLILQEINDI